MNTVMFWLTIISNTLLLGIMLSKLNMMTNKTCHFIRLSFVIITLGTIYNLLMATSSSWYSGVLPSGVLMFFIVERRLANKNAYLAERRDQKVTMKKRGDHEHVS